MENLDEIKKSTLNNEKIKDLELSKYRLFIDKLLKLLRKISECIKFSISPQTIHLDRVKKIFNDIIYYGYSTPMYNNNNQIDQTIIDSTDTYDDNFTSSELNKDFHEYLNKNNSTENILKRNSNNGGEDRKIIKKFKYNQFNPAINLNFSDNDSSQSSINANLSNDRIDGYDLKMSRDSTSQDISYKLENFTKNQLNDLNIEDNYLPTINLWGNDSRKDEFDSQSQNDARKGVKDSFLLKTK